MTIQRQAQTEHKRTLWLAASFHLPFPLAAALGSSQADWGQVRCELSSLLAGSDGDVEVLPWTTERFINFPGGNPLLLKHRAFWSIIPLERCLRDRGVVLSAENLSLDHEIWLCPGGAVLLVARLGTDSDLTQISIQGLDGVVESLYRQFGLMFLRVYELLKNPRSCPSGEIFSWNTERAIHRASETAKEQEAHANSRLDPMDRPVGVMQVDPLSDLIEDVYYLEFHPDTALDSIRIDYVSSTVSCTREFCEPYRMAILAAFASFRELLWMRSFLSEYTGSAQRVLLNKKFMLSDTVESIRLIRLHCLRLVDESHPIQIRLTREFMECVERCWTEFRMHDLVRSIREQISTLMETVDWFDAIRREVRNFRIATIGVLFTTLSFLVVTMNLLSLVYPGPTDFRRIAYVLAGGAGGALLAATVILLPVAWCLRILRPSSRRRLRTHPSGDDTTEGTVLQNGN